ncbi:MAG: nitrate reductase [Hydrogenophilales bacterium 16-64-46]|nr:MAG: nitrate reductase [Hydrogenophilales bacterium 12-64-13]OYZ05792.1 MAG: nitrate reductase [Hydrogenophilales bacterium 16-64-46]OZA39727.1 MAG: nitrate reductase [Hydrogenophilales bacterium 17-64-34]
MSITTMIFAGTFYLATLLLVVGLVYKIFDYSRTPAPLKIPTTPAPITQKGVVYRMAKEVVLFESLFKSNKWIWVFGWLFHFGMLLVLIRHLRYFITPIPEWLLFVQPFGKYASIMMVVGLLGLLARRFLVDRVRYISTPSDYLMLVLLIGIGISGMLTTFVVHTDIVALKQFFMGLMFFDLQPVPEDPIILAHLTMVALLMVIFPISKLLHAPGLFFSPTRNQADNPREHRHVAAWAARLDQNN